MGDSVANLLASGNDSVKVPEKFQLPVDRVLSFHAPAWSQQGAEWPTPENLDHNALEQQAKSLVNKWDSLRSIMPAKKTGIPLHERLAASMFRTTKLGLIGRTDISAAKTNDDSVEGDTLKGDGSATTEAPKPPADLEAAAAEAETKGEGKSGNKKKRRKSRNKSIKGGAGLKREERKRKKEEEEAEQVDVEEKSKAKIAPAGM